MDAFWQISTGFVVGVAVTLFIKFLVEPLKKCACEDDDSLFAKRGKWIARYECVACHHVLTNYEKMHSHGVCPYCGHNANSTVCDTVTKSVEEV